jgi:hypothetical protein
MRRAHFGVPARNLPLFVGSHALVRNKHARVIARAGPALGWGQAYQQVLR